ncbi:hypothetical protein [Brevundimonas denitrificans]|uniref:hypothetical protein n=1 Tax=Brevundimonas denitrificans TaxID=1443434 RepID=UPI00223ACCDA|nr:hypothetical protein [Brevundimonas denitrificans]
MSALERPETLTRFFDALDAAGAGEGERPVHILQLGDSHTVGDMITASVRSRLQNSIGRGGRGVLPPGKPYALYQPRQVELFEQAWTAVTPGPGSAAMSGVGLSGSRALIWGEGSSLRIEAEGSAAFSRVVLCGATDPAAGTLTVRAGFSETAVSFADPTPAPPVARCGWANRCDRRPSSAGQGRWTCIRWRPSPMDPEWWCRRSAS